MQPPLLTCLHAVRPVLVAGAILAAVTTAPADDLFWGSTDGSKLVLYDASTNALVSQNYQNAAYTQFTLIDGKTDNQLGSSLWIAYNPLQQALFGLDNHGDLYSIDTTHLQTDVNQDVGYTATILSTPGLQVSEVKGIAFDAAGQLTISSGTKLVQYDPAKQVQTTMQNSFTDGTNSLQIGGIAYGADSKLLGAVFSPGSGSINLFNATTGKWDTMVSPAGFGASSQANVFLNPDHARTVYFTNGSNRVYSYDLLTKTLSDPADILGAGGNLQSFATDPVPEPGPMLLLGAGLFALLMWRSRREQRAHARQVRKAPVRVNGRFSDSD